MQDRPSIDKMIQESNKASSKEKIIKKIEKRLEKLEEENLKLKDAFRQDRNHNLITITF